MKMDELRSDYLQVLEENKAKAKLEELIDQINKKQTPSEPPPSSGSQQKPTFDPNEIESLVSKKIQEHETSSKQRENFNQIKVKLQERLGNNYQEILNRKMQTLGLTEESTNLMARTNPALFAKTFDLDIQPQIQQNPPQGQWNTNSFKQKEEERTYSYYKKLRKENPKLYNDPRINIQMDKDAQRLGERFFDVD